MAKVKAVAEGIDDCKPTRCSWPELEARKCYVCPDTSIYIETIVHSSSIKIPLTREMEEKLWEIARKHGVFVEGDTRYKWWLTCISDDDCIDKIRSAAREIKEKLGIDMAKW